MARIETDTADSVAPGSTGPTAGHADARSTARDVESAVVDCGLYLDGQRVADERTFGEALAKARQHDNGFVWIGLWEPTDEAIADIAKTFGLHPLAVEDAVHAHQRPKLEEYDETDFIVLKTARYVEHSRLAEDSEVVETGELMIFVGRHFVVTVRHGASCGLHLVRSGLERRSELLRHGPWAVAYGIIDHIVDEYLNVMAGVEDDVEEVEASVFSRRASREVQRVYNLKRELMELRRAVIPMNRPVATLAAATPRPGAPAVPKEVRKLFRDVADHLVRVTDQLHAYDELLSSVLDATLAQIGIQQNNDMRKISAWVAMAAVPTMIAGIYGMNFDHMPELHWYFGYPLVLALMACVSALLYRAFRRSGWL